MSEGKGQRKWPIPEGFAWSHIAYSYIHPDGRHWNSDTNEFWDPKTREYTNVQTPHEHVKAADPRQIEGGGPRILPADIEAAIKLEHYYVDGTLTVCILTMQNGFKVTGESACANPANFNAAKGAELARKAACEKIWPLLGYALRERLHQQGG